MSQINHLVDRYFAAWNETDAEQRRKLIAQTWTSDARYLDPLIAGEGHAGIDAMIAGVQQQFAGYQFRHIHAVDAHHDCIRFSWELGLAGQAAVAAGTDFGIVSADGRLQQITGFLDHTPAAGS